MTPWEVLEQEFRNSFIDYMENEWAFEELRKLKMMNGKVDEYIVKFRRLIHRAGLNKNDGANIRMFIQGLPTKLADIVIDMSQPNTFKEWAKATQLHQQGWMYKRSLRGIFEPSQQTETPYQEGSNQGHLI